MIACDLSLLLEKESANPYPWAVNVLDLESLFDAWEYFGWGLERFCEYLCGRQQMHGKVIAGDELEYAGYMIEHGHFDVILNSDHARDLLEPHYSDVFDDIFYARHGGEPVKYAPHPPVTTDFSAEVRKMFSQAEEKKTQDVPTRRKQGRNEKCDCGSGKKFKRCCGQ